MNLNVPFRQSVALASAVAAASVIACSGGGPSASQQAGPAATAAPQNQARALVAFVVAGDAAVGENRLPIALLNSDGEPILDRADSLTVSYRRQDTDEVFTAPRPVFRPWPVGGGIYTTSAEFEAAGVWEFEVALAGDAAAGVPPGTASALIVVKEAPLTPAIGTLAPVAATRVGTTREELSRITSDPDPKPFFYEISFDDAIASGKPVLITFATPMWCTSRTCGPQLETDAALHDRYRDEVHFIHVEIFDNPDEMEGDPAKGIESPLPKTWGLPSEPWTFIVDRQGRVAAKFEGYTTESELEEALRAVIDSGGGDSS